MGTTTNGLPYPDDTSAVRDGNEAIQSLAEALDTLLYGSESGVTYEANVATVGAGTVAYKRGRSVHLAVSFSVSAGFAAGAKVATVTAGYRPTRLWVGLLWDATTTVVAGYITVDTNGDVKCSALTSGRTYNGSISYAI